MFNATFTNNEYRKTKLNFITIKKVVSFESVNGDSEFFVCLTLATRRKTSFSVIKLFTK